MVGNDTLLKKRNTSCTCGTTEMKLKIMVDSLTLYDALFHKVKLTETNGAVHIETAILYEIEDDSDEGVATIGLTNGYYYRTDEISSIETLD